MSEGYWEKKRRHLNEDHKFRRAQSKRFIGILRGRIRIDRISGEIARRERSNKLKSLLDDMKKQRTSILERMSASSAVRKQEWYERLCRIDLRRPGVDAELQKLLEDVESEQRFWGFMSSNIRFDLPEIWTTLPGANCWAPMGPHSMQKSNPSAALVRLEREKKKIERKNKLVERELALIASSLGVLISTRKSYESTRSQS